MRGVFIGEGTSDEPLAGIVAALFRRRGVDVDVTTPHLERLPLRARTDVGSKIAAARRLTTEPIDVFVVHRDADATTSRDRRAEVQEAVETAAPGHRHVAVVPVRMTEAWLLLDEHAIRVVAGNPNGRMPLHLPTVREVERRADPKARLAEAILTASSATGRHRDRVARRFGEHRRRLLQHLDLDGPVTRLGAWAELLDDVDATVAAWGV